MDHSSHRAVYNETTNYTCEGGIVTFSLTSTSFHRNFKLTANDQKVFIHTSFQSPNCSTQISRNWEFARCRSRCSFRLEVWPKEFWTLVVENKEYSVFNSSGEVVIDQYGPHNSHSRTRAREWFSPITINIQHTSTPAQSTAATSTPVPSASLPSIFSQTQISPALQMPINNIRRLAVSTRPCPARVRPFLPNMGNRSLSAPVQPNSQIVPLATATSAPSSTPAAAATATAHDRRALSNLHSVPRPIPTVTNVPTPSSSSSNSASLGRSRAGRYRRNTYRSPFLNSLSTNTSMPNLRASTQSRASGGTHNQDGNAASGSGGSGHYVSGMTERNIEQLLKYSVQKAAQQFDCGICLETVKCNEYFRCLACAHKFHATCIDQWLLKKAACPICQYEVQF